MISTSWGKAIQTIVEEYTQDGWDMHPDWTPQVFDIKDDPSGYHEFQDSFGPASIPASSEGASSTELSITNGYNTTAVPQIFKAKIAISEELMRWNKYKGQILERSRALGEAGIQTINRFAAGVFIQGFTTTATSYGDGLPLFSTVKSSGTKLKDLVKKLFKLRETLNELRRRQSAAKPERGRSTTIIREPILWVMG